MARVGRPKLDEQDLKKVSVQVRQETMDRIDTYIAQRQAADPRAHLSRSEVLREILEAGLLHGAPARRVGRKGGSDAA